MADTTNKRLSRSKFILTAYSLTAAALMGSSIGLVAYQSRQFFFLSQASRHNLLHPPYLPYGYDDYGLNHTHGDHPPPPHHPSPPPHHPPPPPPFPDHPPPPPPCHQFEQHGHPFLSFFFSTFLPVFVWIGTVFVCAVVINSKNWIPKVVSPRKGLLSSQFMFSIFWIMLASIQDVQEQLVAQKRSSMELNPDVEATEDIAYIEAAHEFKKHISSLVIPMSVIWYMAVVILGVATGLLITCSNMLERQLDGDQYMTDAISREEECLMSYEKHDQEKELTMGSEKCQEAGKTTVTTTTATTTTTTTTASSLSRYTKRQRFILVLLIFGLFMSQMKLFEWVIRVQSLDAYQEGATESVASCLAFVGLVSGAIMISLGVRYLPKEKDAESNIYI